MYRRRTREEREQAMEPVAVEGLKELGGSMERVCYHTIDGCHMPAFISPSHVPKIKGASALCKIKKYVCNMFRNEKKNNKGKDPVEIQ